jgi:hypothetical protein
MIKKQSLEIKKASFSKFSSLVLSILAYFFSTGKVSASFSSLINKILLTGK